MQKGNVYNDVFTVILSNYFIIGVLWRGMVVFNYYRRIADYANELENDGKVKKAEQLRDILKNEERCILCGSKMTYSKGIHKCIQCIQCIEYNYADVKCNEGVN